jgi:glycine/D-amino acid oxidase-like deaminating enzyme
VQRRDFVRQGAAALGAMALAVHDRGLAAPAAGGTLVPRLPPVRASMDRVIKITVCTRPFRAQGPRLDVEQIGHKTVVHNYGHGGSGWSLSWGSASVAVAKAMSTGIRDCAVIGCGALGLTSAITLQRQGVRVTIYAKDLPPELRSMWATGVWSPDSRICLADRATASFKSLWAQMARVSYRAYSNYLGLPGAPVEWYDNYELTEIPYDRFAAEQDSANTMAFADLQREMTPEIGPVPVDLARGSHSFPVPYVRRASNMMFNLIAYQRLLLSDFRAAGGIVEQRELHSPRDLAHLPQKCIINCTGYGARALFGDESIVPVRGQLTRLVPQPEVNYGLIYRNVFVVPRRDGIVLQYFGADEAQGFNDPSTEPDLQEAQLAVNTIAQLNEMTPAPG